MYENVQRISLSSETTPPELLFCWLFRHFCLWCSVGVLYGIGRICRSCYERTGDVGVTAHIQFQEYGDNGTTWFTQNTAQLDCAPPRGIQGRSHILFSTPTPQPTKTFESLLFDSLDSQGTTILSQLPWTKIYSVLWRQTLYNSEPT